MSLAWIQLFNLLSQSPSNLKEIETQRRLGYECIKRKECKSVWREDIQEWVIVPIDHNLELKTHEEKKQN